MAVVWTPLGQAALLPLTLPLCWDSPQNKEGAVSSKAPTTLSQSRGLSPSGGCREPPQPDFQRPSLPSAVQLWGTHRYSLWCPFSSATHLLPFPNHEAPESPQPPGLTWGQRVPQSLRPGPLQSPKESPGPAGATVTMANDGSCPQHIQACVPTEPVPSGVGRRPRCQRKDLAGGE